MSKTGQDYVREQQPGNGRMFTSGGDIVSHGDYLARDPISLWRGLYKGALNMSTHGEKAVIGAGNNVPLWPLDTFPDPLEIGKQMSLVSTSPEDKIGGTGAHRVLITYLDHLLDQQDELIYTNGITPVLTKATDVRWIQNVLIIEADLTAGSPRAAVGDLTLTAGGVTYGVVLATYLNQTSSFRMVPRGYYGYVDEVLMSSVSITADARALIRTVVYSNGLLLPRNAVGVQNSAWSIHVTTGSRLPPGTLLGMTVTCNKALTATGSFIGRLEPIE